MPFHVEHFDPDAGAFFVVVRGASWRNLVDFCHIVGST